MLFTLVNAKAETNNEASLLLESGGSILLESGSNLLME